MSAALLPAAPGADGSGLQAYLRWASPPNFVAALAIFAIWYFSSAPLLLVMSGAVFVNGIISFRVHRLAGDGQLGPAVTWLCAGLWVIALGVSLGGTQFFAVVFMCALLPVLAAFPYVSLRRLLGLGFSATGIVGLGSLLAMSGLLPADPLPIAWLQLLLVMGTVVLVCVFGLSMWQNGARVSRERERMLAANAALRESERTLEARVRQRTEELEGANRELETTLERALEANDQKSAFLASMSHELRTPLNAIIGFSEVLHDGTFGELNEKQAEYTKDIHDSGHHLLSLINDILDLAKVESGELELSVSPFELVATLDDAVRLTRERASRRGVDLQHEVDADLGLVAADERKIKQVVINLLTNAVKFTPQGGCVTLRAERGVDAVCVSVVDTGVGIPQAEQAKIFEDYGQAEGAHTRDQEGTGLGLALSKRLVELHGGRLEVESEVGVGSTFRFSIPNQPAAATPKSRE